MKSCLSTRKPEEPGRVDPEREAFDYVDIATICLWQHMQHYAFMTNLERYPRIAARVARFAERPSVASTAPAVALAEAVAAGWKP